MAVAAYRRAPPGAMASPLTRPDTGARLSVWPRATTDGPMGVQLFSPGIAGMPGATGPPTMATTRRARAATRRFWNSSNRRCQ